MSLIDTLRALAITVRNEKKKEANSAIRIGDLFLAIIDFIKGLTSGQIRQEGVDTYNDTSGGKTSLLSSYPDPKIGWTVLVRQDETNGGKSSLYQWNGSNWINIETLIYVDDVALSGGSDKTIQQIDETKADKTFVYNLSQLANWYSYQSKADARQYIPVEYRGYGQIIIYQLSSGAWIVEQYRGNYGDSLDDWQNDDTKWLDWKDFASIKDVEAKAGKTFIYNLSQLANWYSYQSKADARQYIPVEYRGYGQIIIYQLSSGAWIVEQYRGNYGDSLDDWQNDDTKWLDWKDFASIKDVEAKAGKTFIYNLSQLANWYSYQSKADARQYIPVEYRGYGQIIIYQLSSGAWIVEQYRGNYGDSLDNWQNDDTKWLDLKSDIIFDVSKYKHWYSFSGKEEARRNVPDELKRIGLIITYQLETNEWITEQYAGDYGDIFDKWLQNYKWRSLNPTSNKFQGKRMVWYGTSIPANLYPEMVGEILGAEVHNESYPSSCARRGTINYDDGIGLKGEGWTISWALSQTLAEKEEIINNWDYWKTKFVGDVPDTLDEDQKNVIRWSTYENKIGRYLLGGTVGEVDYYVFDHGHNDAFESDTDEELTMIPADPYDRNYFIGAMNFLIRYIFQKNPRAKVVIIGHYTNDIKGTGRANLICKAQEVIAQYWGLPFCKVWEKAGFSATPTIITNGYWDASGIWHDTGFDGTNNVSSNLTGNDQNPRQENDVWVHDLTPKQIWMRDDLHPHTDLCRMHIAKIIASWMLGNAW